MKKTLPLALAILLIINLYGLYLLKNSYDRSQQEIRSSILQEIENRRQIEESIKKELDSKRQAKQFILQRDQEKILEDLAGQIADNQALTEGYSRVNQQRTDDLSEAISRLSASLKALEESLGLARQELAARMAADQEFSGRLQSSQKTAEERINRLENTLEEQLESFGRQLTQQAIQLEQMRNKLGEVSGFRSAAELSGGSPKADQ